MPAPLLVRPPSEEEQALAAGLRSADAFTVRRCQIVLASARGERAPATARSLSCSDQTVRHALRAFDARGAAALVEGSSRPHTIHAACDAAGAERLRALLPRSPPRLRPPHQHRDAGAGRRGGVRRREHRQPCQRRDGARHARPVGPPLAPRQEVDHQSRPGGRPKKRRRDRLIALAETRDDWAVGVEDEPWWSRVARPARHAWRDEGPLRVVEQAVAKTDPDPKALACSGLLVRTAANAAEAIWLRFVDGRPVSGLTTAFLDWCCQRLAADGMTTLVLVWDNAGWHVSKEVRAWLRAHNQHAQRAGGGRLVPCCLPTKRPWRNPIEPKWVHGTRPIVEPARLLTAQELGERVCAAFDCPLHDHLVMLQEVA